MKKGHIILLAVALLLALALLLTLTTCRKNQSGDPTSPVGTQAQTGNTTGTEENNTTAPNPTSGHTHSYSVTQTKEATCSTKGQKTYTCACGYSYTEDIDTLPHTWDYNKSEIIEKPTLTATGSRKVPCQICGQTRTDTIARISLTDAFGNPLLGEMFIGKEADGQNCMTGETIVKFMLATKSGSVTQSSGDFFAECSKYFAMTDNLKADIKALSTTRFRYNANNGTFTYQANPPVAPVPGVQGFVHNGGNRYTVYYYNSICGCWDPECKICSAPYYIKVELELSRNFDNLNAINRILNVTKVNSVPSDITT